MKYLRYLFFALAMVLTLSGCEKSNNCKDMGFNPMSNFSEGDTVVLDMDLKNVVNQGIVIPSERQCDGGRFVIKFKGEKGKFYKVFYQNESYKFENDNELSCENFYGSWEDTGVGFKRINHSGTVCDSLRIVGNPRDERKYYGKDVTENQFS